MKLSGKKILISIFWALVFFIFSSQPTKAATITADNQVDCPTATTTEILVYFHGLTCPNDGCGNGNQWTIPESITSFNSELGKIRSARPGIAAGHFKYGMNVQGAINTIKTQCGVTEAVPITVAGHSMGGQVTINNAGPLADKIILLDGIYWSPSPLFSYCSKLRVVDGPTTEALTPSLVSNCNGKTGFSYVSYKTISGYPSGIDGHFFARKYLSSFYLDSTPSTSSGTGATTPKKPFILLDPLLDLQVKLPGLDKLSSSSPATCTTTDGTTACSLPWIAIYIKAIYNYAMGIIGILAALALMIGGVIYLTSTGNASRISEAKSWITGALTGMLIMFTSYILLNEVNPDLIGYKPIMLSIVQDVANETPPEAQVDSPTTAGSSHGVPLYRQCSEVGKKIVYNEKNKQCASDPKVEGKYGTQSNPKAPYNGNPNLCTSGCGVLSTFMAVNKYKSVTDLQAFTRQAEQQGARVCGSGSTGYGLIKLAQYYGLTAGDTGGLEGIKKKISEGCVVIISVSAAGKPDCKFTSGGHFIALTGWREENNLIADVNDPAGSSGYPYKGGCTTSNADCKTWISLNDWGGCSLGNHFYVCDKK